MALDLNDLLDPPYGFGECWDETYGASIHCDAWQEPDQTISIYYRKVGSHVTVFIPEFLRPVKAGIGTKDCDIIIDASFPLKSTYSVYNCEDAQQTYFTCNMQIYDEQQGDEDVVMGVIKFNKSNGQLKAEPVTNFILGKESTTAAAGLEVGVLCTTLNMTLETGDTDKEKPDIDMDYEDKRKEHYEPTDPDEPEKTNSLEVDSYAQCTAWSTPKNAVKITLGKKGNQGTIKIPAMLFTVASTISKGYSIALYPKNTKDFYDFYPKGIPQGELAKCSCRAFMHSKNPTIDDYATVEGIVTYYKNSWFQIFLSEENKRVFFGLNNNGVPAAKIGVTDAVTFTFTIPEEEQDAVICPYPTEADIDPSDLPDVSETKSVTTTASCRAWAESGRAASLTFEKTTTDGITTGKIRIPSIMYPAKKTDPATRKDGLVIPCNTAITEFFGAVPSGKLGDCKVHTYCPNHFSDTQY